MREIVALRAGRARWLGAHEGAGQHRVPDLSLLDANGRRVQSSAHRAWLSLRPGEVLECNGCHVRTTANDTTARRTAARVRSTRSTPAPRHRRAVPRHRDHHFRRDRRHDGAGARARRFVVHRRAATGTERCGRTVAQPERERDLRRDLEAGRAAHRLVRFAYQRPARRRRRPTSPGCFPIWTADLPHHHPLRHHRHAPGHIHPLWSVPRPTAGVRRPASGIIDLPDRPAPAATAASNPANMQPQLPAASLELTDEVLGRRRPADCAPIASCCSRAPSSSS